MFREFSRCCFLLGLPSSIAAGERKGARSTAGRGGAAIGSGPSVGDLLGLRSRVSSGHEQDRKRREKLGGEEREGGKRDWA